MASKFTLSPKTKKILNIVADVVAGIILVFALIFAISSISSKAKGYDQCTEIFGKSYLAVQSDSMAKDLSKSDNFAKGDLIKIRMINNDTDRRKLKVGDVITFKTREITEDGTMVLNTHRIIEIAGKEGEASAYITHGDNNPEGSNERVLVSEVVGVFESKSGGIGYMFLFMGSTAGFFVCIVLPTLLIVVYAAVNLVLVIMKERKVQSVASEEAKLSEREKMRAELLAEMGLNAEEVKPAEEQTPAEEEKPAEEEAPVEEEKPVEEETPAEEQTPAEEEKPSEEDTPAEDSVKKD